jgi:pimeloyl-ACP methyl ester carboxylesterase
MQDRSYSRPGLLLAEGPRAITDMASLVQAAPYLYHAPRGDGHSLLVMPGLGASDRSTNLLRSFLSSIGYQAHSWNLGTNRGPGMPDLQAGLAERLDELFVASGQRKVSLVGWSMGGVYARTLAHQYPEKVRQVITLGSPIGGSSRSAANTPQFLASQPLTDIPSSAVFSKTDGIVPWRFATQQPAENAENIEVYGSHIGLGFSPSVFYATADRLAQSIDNWRPFERRGWKRFVYGPARLESKNLPLTHAADNPTNQRQPR